MDEIIGKAVNTSKYDGNGKIGLFPDANLGLLLYNKSCAMNDIIFS